MIEYKGYFIVYKKKPLLDEYEIRSNTRLLKIIKFKKRNIVAINKALTKAKKYINDSQQRIHF